MPVYDLYSKRKKRTEQSEPDVFQYDHLPQTLRAQIHMILEDALGPYVANRTQFTKCNNGAWNFVRDVLRREKGLHELARAVNSQAECLIYFDTASKIDDCLDLIQVAFRLVDTFVREQTEYGRRDLGVTLGPDDAIEELNLRFVESGVGFQFESGQIIRIDSQLLHREAVKPALALLSEKRFKGADEEFRSAHAHYRAGEHKDAVADALNAFESTLKVICDEKGWQYPKGARASDLIKIVRAAGLLPDYLDKSFDQLAATLQSGLPQVRNEAGGHGQGGTPKETPAYIAAYALHLAAAKIVLLVEAFNASE